MHHLILCQHKMHLQDDREVKQYKRKGLIYTRQLGKTCGSSTTELCSILRVKLSIMENRCFLAKNPLHMMEKMMDPNITDYYIINCAIPSIITIRDRYQIDFGSLVYKLQQTSSMRNFLTHFLF